MKSTALFFLLLISSGLFARTVYLKPNQKIQTALNNLKPHDTLIIAKGVYREHPILINKPVTIIGIDYPVIDAESKHENISVHSSYVSIIGLKIINTGYSSMEDMAGIRMYGVHHVQILNNKLENTFFGIYFTNATHCLVKDNEINGPDREQYDIGNGIHFWKSSYNRIIHNTIHKHRDGIYFEFVKNTVIAYNYSEGNIRYGLHFMFSDSDYYYKNTFMNNGAGVAVMYSHHVHMLKNNFVRNWGGAAYGLLLKDIRDSEIFGNTYEKNTVGIHAEGCSRSLFYRNQFIENGYALRLQADCDDNFVSFNNFVLNTFDLVTNGYTVLNNLDYNYWDKYNGYDLARDGVGDQPFRPMTYFAHIVETSPVTVIFLKSFLSDMLDFLEKMIPGLTPENLIDRKPLIKRFVYA